MPGSKLIVISAPSGCGKTTIAREVLRRHPDIEFSVSATTRKKRTRETDGKDYFFLTKQEFDERVRQGELVEWEEIYDELYGSLKREVDRVLNAGNSMLFDIDVKGALSIKKQYGEQAVLIFVKPPSLESLKQRLMSRNTEDEASLKRRLERVPMELEQERHFDYAVVNDNIARAVEEIEGILAAHQVIDKEKKSIKHSP